MHAPSPFVLPECEALALLIEPAECEALARSALQARISREREQRWQDG